MSILVTNVSKRFGTNQVLRDINLKIESGSLSALLGPSGSGKTTLLRIIAGLEAPDSGSVSLHDEDANVLPVRERNIGFVFQHYALFRHMNVFDNIGFSMKMRGTPRAEIEDRVYELLRLIQLTDIGRRYPSQLSGGQRQRVALARALASKPKVLLLDEPFGALDARVRKELRDWLRKLHDEIHVTSVFVTHDQEEALELADQVVVMRRASIEQIGSPEEVYHHPANPFVMQFLGQVNLFHGRKDGDSIVIGKDGEHGNDSVGFVRPHQLDITRGPKPAAPTACMARVQRIFSAGHQVRVDLQIHGQERSIQVLLTQERAQELTLRSGEDVYVMPKEIKVFPTASIGDYAI